MPYYSTFWDRHYDDIGNCCMTAPLRPEIFFKGSNRPIYTFIDTAWMHQKKMKWIGWDADGYFCWITPSGMMYRIDDLERSELGKDFEKEEGKIPCEPEPGAGVAASSIHSTAKEYYEWEVSEQKDCSFCPRDGGGDSESDKDREASGGGIFSSILDTDSDNSAPPNTDWQQYAQGNSDPSGVINNDYVKDPQKYVDQSGLKGGPEGKDKNPKIPPIPYAPPVPMPTPVTPYTPPSYTPPAYTPPMENPVADNRKVKDNTHATIRAPSPFEKLKNKPIPTLPPFKWGSSGKGLGIPASIGTYGVTPTNPAKPPYQNPYDLSEGKVNILPRLPIAPIDNLRVDDKNQYLEEKENEKDKRVEEVGKFVLDATGEFSKKIKAVSKVFATNLLANDLNKWDIARNHLEQVKKSRNNAIIQKATREYQEAREQVLNDIASMTIEVLYSELALTIDGWNVLQILVETNSQYLAQRILQIRKDLENPKYNRTQRIEMQEELKRLTNKFLAKIGYK